MENILRKETITLLNDKLNEDEFTISSNHTVKFVKTEYNCGQFFVNGVNEGDYVIYFVGKLTLVIKSNGKIWFFNGVRLLLWIWESQDYTTSSIIEGIPKMVIT